MHHSFQMFPPNVTLLYFRSAGTFSVFCCPHPHRSVLLRITPLSLVPPRSVPLRISCLRFIIFYRNYRNDSLDETLIRDYFSADTLSQLSDAIQSIHLPAEDTFFECNELLQDLAVNYQSEKLYCDFLNPIISLSEYISESATDFFSFFGYRNVTL